MEADQTLRVSQLVMVLHQLLQVEERVPTHILGRLADKQPIAFHLFVQVDIHVLLRTLIIVQLLIQLKLRSQHS